MTGKSSGGSKGGGSKGPGPAKDYRSAITGRYVKKATADRHPDKTVGEKRD